MADEIPTSTEAPSTPTTASPLRWLSASRARTDAKCRWARYLGHEYQGVGLQAETESYELAFGSVIHDALAAIATQHQAVEAGTRAWVDIDAIASGAAGVIDAVLVEAAELHRMEQVTLMEGLVRGFYRSVWPALLRQWPKIVGVEKECSFLLAEGFGFRARHDLILGNDAGELVCCEYKSTGWKKPAWIDSWDVDIQVQTSFKTIAETLGTEPTSAVVIGLYKGYKNDYGKFSSQLVYGYRRPPVPPFVKEDISHNWRQGYKAHPVWEMPGGVKAWVNNLPEGLLSENFPHTPPIFKKQDLLDDFCRTSALREFMVHQALGMLEAGAADDFNTSIRMDVFPRNYCACKPSFGRGCEFFRLCHSGLIDPLKVGFSLRGVR